MYGVTRIGLCAALAVGCSFDLRADTGEPDIDAATDAPVDGDAVTPAPDHLLLSEIKSNRYALGEQFIELYNPTRATVALANVFVSDSPLYPRLPGIVAGNDAATIGGDDFIARFPPGATIGPGEVRVMSLATPFEYGAEDYSLQAGAAAIMVEAFAGSIGASAQLTEDHGEGVALFFWDGQTDRVIDIDLMIAGRGPMPGDELADKSDLAVDGPDPDAVATAYAPDRFTMPSPVRATGPLETYQRIAPEIGEVLTGGNGVTGHDETTEDVTQSWDFFAPAPFEAPVF